MTHDARANEFLMKLGALLKEYNASISFTFDPSSDKHGLINYGMTIYIDNTNEVFRNENWGIEPCEFLSVKPENAFFTREDADVYRQSRIEKHPNLVSWIEQKDGFFYAFFNVWD